MTKTYKSHVKLDRLPARSAVRFEGSHDWWYKLEGGRWSRYHWAENDFMAFLSKALVNYHNGRPFEVIREGES